MTIKEKWFELKKWIEEDIKYWFEKEQEARTSFSKSHYRTRIAQDTLILDQMQRIEKEKLPWEN